MDMRMWRDSALFIFRTSQQNYWRANVLSRCVEIPPETIFFSKAANVVLGVKLAMCKQSICDFRAPWKDHRQTDQQRQTHDTREFSRVIPTQQGEFQEVTTRGNANHVGSKNPLVDTIPLYLGS